MSNKDLKIFEKNIGYSFKDIEHLKKYPNVSFSSSSMLHYNKISIKEINNNK